MTRCTWGTGMPGCAAERYDAFIAAYLQTASSTVPGALLHFEDFGADNARRILVSYRDEVPDLQR